MSPNIYKLDRMLDVFDDFLAEKDKLPVKTPLNPRFLVDENEDGDENGKEGRDRP